MSDPGHRLWVSGRVVVSGFGRGWLLDQAADFAAFKKYLPRCLQLESRCLQRPTTRPIDSLRGRKPPTRRIRDPYSRIRRVPPALIFGPPPRRFQRVSRVVGVRNPEHARGLGLASPSGTWHVLEACTGLKTVLARALKCPCHEIMHSAMCPVNHRFSSSADLEAN